MAFFEAALRSGKYFSDPFDPQCKDDPGEALANDLASGMRERGYTVGVLSNEPLWVVKAAVRAQVFEIIVSLYEPNSLPDRAIWNVSVPRQQGLLARLFRRQVRPEVIELVNDVHDVLTGLDGVSPDIRCFNSWPAAPFDTNSSFSRQPVRNR